MQKSQMSHIVKLFLIALFFVITPLLSPGMRSPYLYFLLNLLIIALGAEAGLLSFLKPQEDMMPAFYAPKPIDCPTQVITEASVRKDVDAVINTDLPELVEKKVKKVEKSMSARVVSSVKVRRLKKCPSTPSIFFIGDDETEIDDTAEYFQKGREEYLSKQELYTKAETFIGNFYNQLKIQREDSWRKIHGLYHKAF